MLAFVTGGTGFVGAHVIHALVERKVDVLALVRPRSARQLLAGLPVQFVEGDLSTVESFKNALQGVDCLFHVAADYRLWVPDPRHVHAVNVQGTERLIQAAHEAKIGRIIYTSSAVTVRVPANRPGTEEDFETPGDCRSTYQRTKVLAEQAVWRLIRAGARVTIVNPSTAHQTADCVLSEPSLAGLPRCPPELGGRPRCCGRALARRHTGRRRTAVHLRPSEFSSR